MYNTYVYNIHLYILLDEEENNLLNQINMDYGENTYNPPPRPPPPAPMLWNGNKLMSHEINSRDLSCI